MYLFQPFFLFLPFQAPHFPLHDPPASCSGWNNHIQDPKRRQYAGMTQKYKVHDNCKYFIRNRMGIVLRMLLANTIICCSYIDMMTCLDESIGNITMALEDHGLMNNTILYYSSGEC